MKKKTFFILIIPALAIVAGYLIRETLATSNPHDWSTGLVGYWSFDGQYTTTTSGVDAGTKDVSNNGNWGAFNGGVQPAPGVVGQALSFDGVDDYVNVGNDASLNMTDVITMEAWIKPNTLSIFQGSIVDNNWEYYAMYQKNNQIGFKYYNEVPAYQTAEVSTANFTLTEDWHHIVTIIDSINGVSVYADGILRQSWAFVGTSMYIQFPNLYVGRSAGGNYFNGLMDEVRIYNRALSAKEVKQHYDQTRRNVQINNPSGTPPVAYWNFNEGSGSIARDTTVNANTGTLKGEMATSSTYGWVDGKVGKGLSFDGVDDYVDAGSGASLAASNETTIVAWIKTTSSGTQRIVHKGDSWYIYANKDLGYASGKLVYRENIYSQSLPQFYNGQWHHIVATNKVGESVKFYFDGVIIGGDSTVVTNVYSTSRPLEIGRNVVHDVPRDYFNGLIDEVRIYNYARTASQIADDYRAGAYRTIVASSVPSDWWTDGLVGYWSFDGQYVTSTAGTVDVSGNGNWGTFNGGVKPIGGIVGQALSFDGVDDYVDLPNNLGYTTQVSAFAWFKSKGTPLGGYHLIIGGQELEISSPSATGEIRTGVYTTARYVSNHGSGLVDGNWHYVGFTFDGSVKRSYIDGQYVGEQNVSGALTYSFSYRRIGRYGSSLTYYANGLIDEVRIYNRALSADEVMQHYEQTRRNLRL